VASLVHSFSYRVRFTDFRCTGPVPTAIPTRVSPELDPTYNLAGTAIATFDPAGAETRTQKLRPPLVNHVQRLSDSLETIM